jgi:hypothetical protein
VSHVDDVARAWRALLFAPTPVALHGVGPPSAREIVYRDLVRRTLAGTIRRACPHARRIAGEDAFDRLLARAFAEAPPTTPFLHGVPGQYTAWLQTLPVADLPHPAFAELCHYEALEVEVTLATIAREEPPNPPTAADIDDGVVVVIDPSTRLCAYRYPVHRVTSATTTWPAMSSTPVFLCCFQRAEVFTTEVVSPAVARTLVLAADGVTVGAALAQLADEARSLRTTFDGRRVRADLVDLQRRGALVGFRRA